MTNQLSNERGFERHRRAYRAMDEYVPLHALLITVEEAATPEIEPTEY